MGNIEREDNSDDSNLWRTALESEKGDGTAVGAKTSVMSNTYDIAHRDILV